MAPPIAPQIVIAPPASKAPRHSLLRVGHDLLNFDGDDTEISRDIGNRWEAGVQFLAEGCDSGGMWAPCSNDAFTPGDTPAFNDYIPFVAWAPWTCSSWSRRAIDFKGRARRKLESVASHWLEREFWTGAVAQANGIPNLYLGGPTVTILNPLATSTPLVYGFGLLEQALSECLPGGEGTIHMSRMVATLLESAHVIHHIPDEQNKDTIRFFSQFGHEIIVGSGYDGSAPTSEGGAVDATGDTQWIYATSTVGVKAGEIQMTPERESQALDRATNTLTYVATQTVAATWDGCCHLGINLSLCSTCCVSPLIIEGST